MVSCVSSYLMACPPTVNLCQLYTVGPTTSQRFRTIKLTETTGLTFFCKGGRIYGIHGHNLRYRRHCSNFKNYLSAFDRLSFRFISLCYAMSKYKLLAYRYLLTSWYIQDYPNSKPHLTADQIRTGSSIDYYIGPCIPHSKGNVISTCIVPTVLLYDEPDMGNSISAIGIAGFNSKDTWPEDIIRLQTP